MKAYKLKFQSSFHIDAGTAVDGPSETFIHSDTLFSALVSSARKFYGDEIAQKFLEPTAIVISSAFPFYKDDFFLPKPLNFFPKILNYEVMKDVKKIKFVNFEHFEKINNNFDYSQTDYFDKEKAKKFLLNKCWRTKEKSEDENIFGSLEVPHIIMDRVSNQTQIYYKTEVYFHKNAGLYFIAEVTDDLLQKFETVLRFLGDEGIGADRTIGKGLFEVEEIQNFSLPLSQESDYYYSLSLYSPPKEEFKKIEPRKSFYNFTIRGGWISNNTLNRKSLRMFVEGSVLKLSNKQKPVGCLHKVLEKKDYENDLLYDIYRSGQAIFLPITGGVNDND